LTVYTKAGNCLNVASRRDLHDEQFAIRVRKRELAAWRRAAKNVDEPLSLWARKMLNLAAMPPPPSVPPTVSGDQIELPLPPAKKRSA
jgi:hypothetical protein